MIGKIEWLAGLNTQHLYDLTKVLGEFRRYYDGEVAGLAVECSHVRFSVSAQCRGRKQSNRPLSLRVLGHQQCSSARAEMGSWWHWLGVRPPSQLGGSRQASGQTDQVPDSVCFSRSTAVVTP